MDPDPNILLYVSIKYFSLDFSMRQYTVYLDKESMMNAVLINTIFTMWKYIPHRGKHEHLFKII